MDKSSVLKAFNTHLMEFLDDCITIFPSNMDLKTAKTFVSGLKKVNPKKLIVTWNQTVTLYRDPIEKGDFSFFEEKDYKEDFIKNGYGKDTNDFLKIIENIKNELKKESESNKKKAIKYVQNLLKLCDMYFM